MLPPPPLGCGGIENDLLVFSFPNVNFGYNERYGF